MSKWGKCAACAAAVLFCQSAVRADYLTVQDPIFSHPLVPYGSFPASPDLSGTGWTTHDPNPSDPFGTGVLINANDIVWQNPDPNDPYRGVGHVDNLISDNTITWNDVKNIDSTLTHWDFPYQGCASIGAATGNEFAQILGSTFQANKAYTLTVAVGHNYNPNPDDIPAPLSNLRIEIFYIDGSSRHLVQSRDIFNDAATGLSANHLLDFSTTPIIIAPGDPAVGQSIGILLTTFTPADVEASGYFNVTNVRVFEDVPEPATLAIMLAGTALLWRRRRT